MNDIVERLRARRCPPVMANKCRLSDCTCKVQEEAAAEIARLRSEVERLKREYRKATQADQARRLPDFWAGFQHGQANGAEAMREAAAQAAMEWNLFLAGEIRALPLPQEARDE